MANSSQPLLQGIPGDVIRITTNPWTEPFWKAAAQGRFIAQCCVSCSAFRMPPAPFCPNCQATQMQWETLSGRGELYSYTVCYKSPFPDRAPELIYAPAVVEFPQAGRIRLVGNLVDIAREDIRIGMPVQLRWNPTSDGYAVPWFCAAPAAE